MYFAPDRCMFCRTPLSSGLRWGEFYFCGHECEQNAIKQYVPKEWLYDNAYDTPEYKKVDKALVDLFAETSAEDLAEGHQWLVNRVEWYDRNKKIVWQKAEIKLKERIEAESREWRRKEDERIAKEAKQEEIRKEKEFIDEVRKNSLLADRAYEKAQREKREQERKNEIELNFARLITRAEYENAKLKQKDAERQTKLREAEEQQRAEEKRWLPRPFNLWK